MKVSNLKFGLVVLISILTFTALIFSACEKMNYEPVDSSLPKEVSDKTLKGVVADSDKGSRTYVSSNRSSRVTLSPNNSISITTPASRSEYCYFYFRNSSSVSVKIKKIVGNRTEDEKTVMPGTTECLFPHSCYSKDVEYVINNDNDDYVSGKWTVNFIN